MDIDWHYVLSLIPGVYLALCYIYNFMLSLEYHQHVNPH